MSINDEKDKIETLQVGLQYVKKIKADGFSICLFSSSFHLRLKALSIKAWVKGIEILAV